MPEYCLLSSVLCLTLITAVEFVGDASRHTFTTVGDALSSSSLDTQLLGQNGGATNGGGTEEIREGQFYDVDYLSRSPNTNQTDIGESQ